MSIDTESSTRQCWFTDHHDPWPVWLSWLEFRPVKQKITGLIPGQGTRVGCGLVSSQGTSERQVIDVSLPPSLSLFLPLWKINKHVLRWGLKKKEIIMRILAFQAKKISKPTLFCWERITFSLNFKRSRKSSVYAKTLNFLWIIWMIYWVFLFVCLF